MLSREKNVLTLIYPRRPAERQVLLGLKKRGFGAGKWNGFGGKVEPGENVEESAVRELLEESCFQATPSDLRWCGTLTYIYDTKPKGMEVHIFDLENWSGESLETEEMKPAWFLHDDVPLKEMWADDEHWLLQYLDGELRVPFTGRFRFKGHEGADSWVIKEQSLTSLAAVPAPLASASAGAPPGAALVVSTVSFSQAPEGSARPLESFIRYHLSRGFAHIFLVIDNATDKAALAAANKFPQARVSIRIRGDALLEEQRAACSSFEDLAPLIEAEVSARQMLDAELAMALAPRLGCNWVVCLDSDELFFTREASVVPHFEGLVAAGIDQMTYLNHEGVPEVLETQDYFATITLFRRHHFAVPLTSEARAGLRFWMDRSRRGQYLLFYDNGKSICRTGLGARPKSQHLWILPPGHRSCTALADPRNLDVEGYRECADPCILHFPVCGLAWLRAKYQTLGAFPDSWLGGKVKLPQSFHTDCRDACAVGPSGLDELFTQEVLLNDAREIARQVASGVCLRITGHTIALDSVARPLDTELAEPSRSNLAGATSLEAEDDNTAKKATVLPDAGPQGIERGWLLSKAMAYL